MTLSLSPVFTVYVRTCPTRKGKTVAECDSCEILTCVSPSNPLFRAAKRVRDERAALRDREIRLVLRMHEAGIKDHVIAAQIERSRQHVSKIVNGHIAPRPDTSGED
jgi:hypothetical protein